MRKIVVILFVLNCLFEGVYGQISINYMEEIPVVDGYLDQNLDKINLTEMTAIYKTREDNPDVPVHYLAGYTDNYFYLYIEAEADHIIERDRAYQNGDGFHLMIGKPQLDNAPTDEFYLLGFSPQKNWSHKMVWYYNVDLSMQRLGDEVLFATNEDKGKIGFELLLPWRSVAPYHPWLGKIGLNLCFVKAIGGNEKNHHFITMDGRMQSEQSLRKYVPAEFEKPNQSTEIVSALTANHIRAGESFSVNVRKWEQQDSQTTISIKFSSGENKIVNFHKEKVTWKTGFNEILISPAQNLMPGGYKLEISENKQLSDVHYLTVLPKTDTETLKADLQMLKPSTAEGTYNTLLFYIENLESLIADLKSYETGFEIRETIYGITGKIKDIENGKDPIMDQTGVYRRAFLSEIDTTLRPYSIYIPDNYTPAKAYPLLVYLHGSGNDDRVLDHTITNIKQGFIILAPNGRGTSNCYATKESQTDIIEAINDVQRVFNIKKKQIVLSGFSMGGYGVYRTYYEHPELFSAIAVLSGHPNLAQKWGDSKELNFFEDENLVKFSAVPIFIYHGREDLNCPFEMTEELVKKMTANNFDVTFMIGEKGHGGMSKAIISQYHDWLRNQVRN